MHRTGLKITVFSFLFLLLFSLVSAPIAWAEEDLFADGEPTDPEQANRVCLDAGIDLQALGYDIVAAGQSWFEALMDFLRSLATPSGGTGS